MDKQDRRLLDVIVQIAEEENISLTEAIDVAINTLKVDVQRRKSFKVSAPNGQGVSLSGGAIEKGRPVIK